MNPGMSVGITVGGETRPPASVARRDGLVLTCAGYGGAVRWRKGERLEQLFERRCDALSRDGNGDTFAVDGGDVALSYGELDARANQLARFLGARRWVRPGDRVALLFDQAVTGYVGMLAVMKLKATYVPLDPGFPLDRVSYITDDAKVTTVLSQSSLAHHLAEDDDGVRCLFLDELDDEIRAEKDGRLGANEVGKAVDETCYVIYTSGTTGRPKGVAVEHASICNFVRVAAEVYGITAEDRVYQGLTIAFDFSVEEIWVAWMAGATLVPRPSGRTLIGPELHDFLTEHHVTALCCVPTLLATLDQDLPELRFLLVSGETCPQDLVERWHSTGRRFLNVYGPTEATVSATWTLLHPDRQVTIGVPLPTYSVVVLDPNEDRALPQGATGELGIAGVGLAKGYLGGPERTARAFVPDFLDLPDNPTGRIYRTGDLCRVNQDGEIEHRGRIDTQVKIRGYRVEPGEIESVLRQVLGIAQAIVDVYAPEPGLEELVAYYSARPGTVAVDPSDVYRRLRDELPAYMVPAYLEQLDEVPVMPTGKVDRRRLPAPRGCRRLGAGKGYVAPSSEIEAALAGELASVLGVDRISVEGNFFEDLGANSLLLARWGARLRSGGSDLPRASMKDVYLHPTVRELARALSGKVTAREPVPAWREPRLPAAAGTPRYILCGTLQLLVFLGYLAGAAFLFDVGASWLAAGHGVPGIYGRSVVFGGGALLGMGVLPVLAKWILIGRFKSQGIRVWSLAYLRFWIVKTLIVANPLAHLVVGSPLYTLYLRALGARIGPRVLIFTKHVPVCADLVSIGGNSVIHKETFLNGYRAQAGVIEIGPVALGKNTFVGERTVLDIYATMEDGAQLGHSSSLQAGQVVPAGACWHGSPAEPAPGDYDYRTVPAADCGTLRRVTYGARRLVLLAVIAGPLEVGASTLLLTHPRVLDHLSLVAVPVIAAALLLAALLACVITSVGLPQLLARALRPGKTYPLYGFHFTLQRLVARVSNNRWMTHVFGDSGAIVHYLRALGYRFGMVEQTGSNFGTDVRQEVPTLSHIGTGTMVSDGLSIMNAEFSSTSFRVMPVVVGKRNYMGNDISFPAGARTGDNCLFATKAMVPIGGPRRSDVGLLGSPSFEIPRSVLRDQQFNHLSTGPERRRRLAAKTRHNAVTVAWHLLVSYVLVLGLVVTAVSPLGGIGGSEWAGTLASSVLEVVFVVCVFALAERAVTGFRALQPRICSIYALEFWRHERYWKVAPTGYVHMFDGTPFKSLVWRLLGVAVGRRVFDDGVAITERTLVSIGHEASLNMGSHLQSHTLEDGTFKSDHITIGNGCTVGTGALVNYGVTMEDGSELAADSFLMKGSHVISGGRWRGNPANEIQDVTQ
ncbi:MAG: amino acid adenylation domain-containing protein [Actinomycetota bacterium]|nr:amino acid adenylation domain-containing protein [Actinomycetota bacterium]